MSLPENQVYRSLTECVQFMDHNEDTVFDFGPYFFSHKCTPEDGLHIMVCTINFMPIKNVPCEDIPGKYFKGVYITGTGKYLFDCTEAKLYKNTEAIADIPAFLQLVNDLQRQPFMHCVRREVFEMFSCNYDAWLERMQKILQEEDQEMSSYELNSLCYEMIQRGDI